MSHDLRGPLRAIEGFADHLARKCDHLLDEGGREDVARIGRAAARMQGLIESLLALSRAGRVALEREAVDLGALVREILDELRRAEPQRRVEVKVAEGLLTRADPTLARQALENLLANAWKFTAARDVTRIEIGQADRRGQVMFFVRDNGVGFPSEEAEEVFRPFRRLHGDDYPGTGIGLAIVERIVRRHGGEVWAEGAVDRGATLYFTL